MTTRASICLLALALGAGCSGFTDPATRLAYDIEVGADKLGDQDGARGGARISG